VGRATSIATVGPEKYYFEHLKSLVDWNRIANSKLKIVVDSMHGCGGYLLEELLRDTSCSVQTIRGNADPFWRDPSRADDASAGTPWRSRHERKPISDSPTVTPTDSGLSMRTGST
jgi:phosphoglucomutase